MLTIRPYSAGVTLLELLVVLAVVSVVAAIGAPPLDRWLARHRVAAPLQALHTDLHRARHEAVMRNRVVVVCASDDAHACSANDWSAGWISFVNTDGDQPAERDASEPLLSVHQAAPHTRLTSNRMRYAFRGDLRRATNGRVVSCDAASRVSPRVLVVSFTGRARLTPPGTSIGSLACP
ncbi:MAG: GspH/FimT family protein [Pseudomonadota bacterium]